MTGFPPHPEPLPARTGGHPATPQPALAPGRAQRGGARADGGGGCRPPTPLFALLNFGLIL